MIPSFNTPDLSHEHSLKTLNVLYEHDDFMESLGSVLDLGCGAGLDLEWWATRTTRDLDNPRPLGIRCVGIDRAESFPMSQKHKNIGYQCVDFEKPIIVGKKKYDVLWCHDAFQYVIDPFTTLKNWRDAAAENSMLVIIVPQTTNIEFNKQVFEQASHTYWHWTMVNLIHVLAVSGWDVAGGFFKKDPDDPWIHAAVYRSDREPQDPRSVGWYDLLEQNALPESAAKSVYKHGYLRQQDLLLPWLDRSLQWFGAH